MGVAPAQSVLGGSGQKLEGEITLAVYFFTFYIDIVLFLV